MHWIWRAALAVAVGFIVQRIFLVPLPGVAPLPPTTLLQNFIAMMRGLPLTQLLGRLLGVTVPVVVYIYLTRRYEKAKPDDGELRCRKCQYILKGLTAPRCPECGEAI